MGLSFIAGFSFGLLLLPVALLQLYVVVRWSPQWAEAVGFLEGIGWTLLLIAYLNADPGGLNARPWLYVGTSLTVLAATTYSVARVGRLR